MNSALTVIIPTYNRPDRLRRALRYWSQSPYQLLVADGSDLSNEAIAKEFNISNYFWDNKSSLVDRWVQAIHLVKTEFLLICADDDFVGFDACEKCVDYLQVNPNTSAALGLLLYFDNSSKRAVFSKAYEHYRVPFFETRCDLPIIYAYNKKELKNRICHGFRFYYTFMYAVQRTSCIKNGLHGFPKLTNDNPFEIQFNLINLMFGEMVILPFLFGVRESIEGSAGSRNSCITKWMHSDPESFKIWCDFCISRLVEASEVSLEEAKLIFSRAISAYQDFILEYWGDGSIEGFSIANKLKNFVKKVFKNTIPIRFLLAFRDLRRKKLESKLLEPNLVSLTRNEYGVKSVPDAIRIQNAILAESEL